MLSGGELLSTSMPGEAVKGGDELSRDPLKQQWVGRSVRCTVQYSTVHGWGYSGTGTCIVHLPKNPKQFFVLGYSVRCLSTGRERERERRRKRESGEGGKGCSRGPTVAAGGGSR